MTGVAPGAYVVFAKTTLVQTSPTGDGGAGSFARCTLNGEPSTESVTDDYAETELGRGGDTQGDVGRATLATHVTTTLQATGSFTLSCRRTDNNGTNETVVGRETKIIAVKLGTATRTPVGG